MKLKRRKSEEIDPFDDVIEDDINDNDAEMDDLDLNDGLNDLNDDFFGDTGQDITMKKHSDLLKELTNFSPYLKESLNNWLGVTWNEELGKYQKNPMIPSTMSIQGGAWCAGYLKTYARNNNIITNLDDDTYANIMADQIEAIWLNLGTRDEFGINNDGDLLRVANEMEHATALVLKGAADGKYNKLLGSTSTYNYSNNTTGMMNQPMNQQVPVQQRRGMVANLMKKMGIR